MSSNTEYVLRTYGDGTYGVGETVVDGVVLFRDGNFNISLEEAQAKYRKATTPVVQK